MHWKKRHFSLLTLIFFSVVNSAIAQESYTLKQLIDEALLKNYDVRLARIEETQARNNNTYGNAGFLPTLDAGANLSNSYNSTNQKYFTGETRNADGAKNTSLDASLELNWTVFDGFRMFAEKRRFANLEKMSAVNTRYFIEQTITDLAKSYFQLKQEEKLMEAYRASLAISNERLKLEKQKFSIGISSGLDVQKALMDRNSDSSVVVYQQARIGSLIMEINRIIDREPSSTLDVADSLKINGSIDKESLLVNAMKSNSQVELYRLQELVAGENVNLRKSGFYPEVGLFGNYSYRRSTSQVGLLESNQAYGPSYGIQIRFNLFNGGTDKIALENSKLDMEYATLKSDQLTNKIHKEISAAYLNYQTGLQGLKLQQENLEVARQTLAIAKKQYELRVISDIEFRLIQLSALEAESDYLRQQFTVKSLEIDLYRISGELLNNIY